MSRKSKNKKKMDVAEDGDSVELSAAVAGDEAAARPMAGESPDIEDSTAGAVDEAEAESPQNALEAALAARTGEYEDLKDRHLRLVAEFDNFRKRTNKQLTESHAAGQASLIGKLLDALDDLGRVAHLDAEQTAASDVLQGIELVEKKIFKELEAVGLEKIGEPGEAFDPNHHEAIGTVQLADGAEANTVANVVQPGYRVGVVLLRPAMVQVYM